MRLTDAIVLDSPGQGEVVSDAVPVRGWCVSGGQPALPVVSCDGHAVRATLWPQMRDDVAHAIGGQVGLAYGFEGWVDLARRPAGEVLLRFEQGDSEVELAVQHRPSTIELQVERPRGTPPLLHRIAAGGWVGGDVNGPVELLLQGHGFTITGGVSQPRDDVSVARPGTPILCGWELFGELPWDVVGPVPFVVVATDATGQRTSRHLVGERPSEADPYVALEGAERRDGTIAVQGFVLWPSPAPRAPRALVRAGDQVVAQGAANGSRPDLFWTRDAAFADVRCGFDLAGEDPSPSEPLPLEVTVRAEDGRVVSTTLTLPPAEGGRRRHPELVDAVRSVAERGSPVLDCDASLAGTGLDAEYHVVEPVGSGLTYLDDAFDVVVVAARGDRAAAERIARCALIVVGEESLEVVRHDEPAELPSVSVVVPLYGDPDLAERALRAVLASEGLSAPIEVIAVDDADPHGSGERAEALAREDARLRVERLPENVGYLRATNRGAALATGDLLLLLNNDCIVEPRTVARLAETLQRHPNAGAVGGKLLYPDGRLQEAGGVIFRDGDGMLLGMRSWNVDFPTFETLRPVDYCSAALTMLPRPTWEGLGGYDDHFAPAYYEDTDLAMRLRERGLAFLYQPRARAVHHLGTATGRAGIERGRERFVARWGEVLEERHPEHPRFEDLETWRALALGAVERAPAWRTP